MGNILGALQVSFNLFHLLLTLPTSHYCQVDVLCLGTVTGCNQGSYLHSQGCREFVHLFKFLNDAGLQWYLYLKNSFVNRWLLLGLFSISELFWRTPFSPTRLTREHEQHGPRTDSSEKRTWTTRSKTHLWNRLGIEPVQQATCLNIRISCHSSGCNLSSKYVCHNLLIN